MCNRPLHPLASLFQSNIHNSTWYTDLLSSYSSCFPTTHIFMPHLNANAKMIIAIQIGQKDASSGRARCSRLGDWAVHRVRLGTRLVFPV